MYGADRGGRACRAGTGFCRGGPACPPDAFTVFNYPAIVIKWISKGGRTRRSAPTKRGGFVRHSGACRNPGTLFLFLSFRFIVNHGRPAIRYPRLFWIPACAGMTAICGCGIIGIIRTGTATVPHPRLSLRTILTGRHHTLNYEFGTLPTTQSENVYSPPSRRL